MSTLGVGIGAGAGVGAEAGPKQPPLRKLSPSPGTLSTTRLVQAEWEFS